MSNIYKWECLQWWQSYMNIISLYYSCIIPDYKNSQNWLSIFNILQFLSAILWNTVEWKKQKIQKTLSPKLIPIIAYSNIFLGKFYKMWTFFSCTNHGLHASTITFIHIHTTSRYDKYLLFTVDTWVKLYRD